MRLAQRSACEKSDEFKARYRLRAGVEATMSEYDRKTGVKHLRMRGFKAVWFCAPLKAVGVKIFKATDVLKAVNNRKAALQWALPSQVHAFFVVKERFLIIWCNVRNFLVPFLHNNVHMPIAAA